MRRGEPGKEFKFADRPVPRFVDALLRRRDWPASRLCAAGKMRPSGEAFTTSTITKLRQGENKGEEETVRALVSWLRAQPGGGPDDADALWTAWLEQNTHPDAWAELKRLRKERRGDAASEIAHLADAAFEAIGERDEEARAALRSLLRLIAKHPWLAGPAFSATDGILRSSVQHAPKPNNDAKHAG